MEATKQILDSNTESSVDFQTTVPFSSNSEVLASDYSILPTEMITKELNLSEDMDSRTSLLKMVEESKRSRKGNSENDKTERLPIANKSSQGQSKIKENEMADTDADLNFEDLKKKKRKSTKASQPEDNTPETKVIEKKVAVADRLWNSVDAEYTYDYLLSRFYGIVRRERPDVDVEVTAKLVLKPPLIFRVGSKKTSFANFIDICKVLHRLPQHLMAFLLVEMGTSGSLDGKNQLIIKGRFQQKQIENIIRRYIKEYVRCATCNSNNTVIQKHIRLTFLVCESCESKRSVVSIKSGYQALTSKRAAMRAKTDL